MMVHHFVLQVFYKPIIIENNNIFSFGRNINNELGNGSNISQNIPLLISSFENKLIIKLITGGNHTFALSSIFNI